jgi:hypothetical protein
LLPYYVLPVVAIVAGIDNDRCQRYYFYSAWVETRMRLVRGFGPTPDALFFGAFKMHICYLDESGTPEASANSSHFVLMGIAIPAERWKDCDGQVNAIKAKFALQDAEIHTAWMLRDYPEQRVVKDFRGLSFGERRKAVLAVRSMNIARSRSRTQHRELAKNYAKTAEYVHLAREQRLAAVGELAELIAGWTDAVLFAEAQDKTKARSDRAFDFAFEQVVTRFNTFLGSRGQSLGIIVQDNNPTIASRLTATMRRYHSQGTRWSEIDRIIETPLFVDSHLTSMVQLADLCAYAVRRFCEKGERELWDKLVGRFDAKGSHLVGIRHFTGKSPCACEICTAHGRSSTNAR